MKHTYIVRHILSQKGGDAKYSAVYLCIVDCFMSAFCPGHLSLEDQGRMESDPQRIANWAERGEA